MNSLITVHFHQQALVVLEKNSRRWVAMKRLCEAIGIDWEPQRKRIKRDPILSSVTCTIKATGADGKQPNMSSTTSMMEAVAADGKQREMLFIDLDYLNGWLFGIDANRVKPELRERVIEYQRECYKVLADHFHAREQWALSKAEARNLQAERAYFKRYPERRTIRSMALQGEPYWFIGLSVKRSAATVGKAIRHMIEWALMTQQQLDTARIGFVHWCRYRRKYVNQLSFGF